jgi:hypothetical protein
LFTAGTLSAIRFTFNAIALGGFLPTHAGIVWTDVGFATPPLSVGPVTFEAFGPGLVSLGAIGPVTLGDGVSTRTTAEDRFFGVINPGGVSAIEIRMSNSTDWEVDHLQFALTIPEPAPWMLALSGLVLVIAAKKFRTTRRVR